MAKESVKFLYGSAVVIGAIATIQYFRRQKQLLKGICISNTSFEWKEVLNGLLFSDAAADFDGIPLSLLVVNNSNIDVVIKDIDLKVSVDGINLGTVVLDEEVELTANTETQLDLIITLDSINWLQLGLELLLGPNVYKIKGNFVISASVFETLNIPYTLVFKGNGSSGSGSTTTEISGDCKVT